MTGDLEYLSVYIYAHITHQRHLVRALLCMYIYYVYIYYATLNLCS